MIKPARNCVNTYPCAGRKAVLFVSANGIITGIVLGEATNSAYGIITGVIMYPATGGGYGIITGIVQAKDSILIKIINADNREIAFGATIIQETEQVSVPS